MAPFINIDGRKVTLDEGYEIGGIGSIGIFDILQSFLEKQSWLQPFAYSIQQNGILICKNQVIQPICNKYGRHGKEDEIGVIILFLIMCLCFFLTIWFFFFSKKETSIHKEIKEEEEKDPPRDFTIDQLRDFNGESDKPIYIALCGDVYDVTVARDMYGNGASYHCFAGRDASRAMAKLSFEEEDLSNNNIDDLSPFEKDILRDWVDKYKYYKSYPIVGKVSTPSKFQVFNKDSLSQFNGTQDIPTGRVDAPIYLAIRGKVLDVSYGGKEMYGIGGPYHLFAGKDASKALAKMSFDQADIESSDLSDLTPEQLKTLQDWEKKFLEVRKYPIVGELNL